MFVRSCAVLPKIEPKLVTRTNCCANLIALLVRLLQIEKYMMHISRSDDLLSRLSPQERRFAKRYLLTAPLRLAPIVYAVAPAVYATL